MSRLTRGDHATSRTAIEEKSTDAGDRLVAIDYLKGIAVIWFTIGHNIMNWEDHTWRSLASIIALSLDWTGPGLFIAFTVLGTMISIRRRMMTGKTRGIFKNACIKSSFLLMAGEILNLAINAMSGNSLGFWHLFGANMITDVALAQLLTFGLVKISLRLRSLLLIMLCVLYPILLVTCLKGIGYDGSGSIALNPTVLNNPAYLAYYLLFYMDAMSPTMSWLITAFLGSILFESFTKYYTTSIGKQPDIQAQKRHAERLIMAGCCTFVISILMGGFVIFRGLGMSGWLYDFLVSSDPFRFYTLSGLPLILVRHVPQYLAFNAGILLIAFGLFYYRSVVRRKKLAWQASVARLGKYSFSIFLYGYALALIPVKLPLYLFVPANVAIIAIIFIVFKFWHSRAHCIGSVEWILGKYVIYVSAALKHLETRSRNHQKLVLPHEEHEHP